MNALGGRGIRVQRPGEMGHALREAFASDAPTCIDVVTNGSVPVSQVI
jgi:thiamine pyrophosphate-dependent acetolactate synthase large subunit-like protein